MDIMLLGTLPICFGMGSQMLVDKGIFTFSIDSWVCGYTFLPAEDFDKGTGI